MKYRNIFLHFCIILAFSLSGCAPSSPDDEAEITVVALVMKSLANEFFKTMAEGASTHQAQHNDRYELISNGIRNESDLTEQINIVEQMIACRVDAIVIAPADSKALAPVLKRATDAGVVVINIDNRLDRDVLKKFQLSIPFVGPDNREGARAVAQTITNLLPKQSPVAIIEGIPTAFNIAQRRLGFEDTIKAAVLELVSTQSGSWEMAKANTVAAGLLSEHPETKAIFCANDSMALGTEKGHKRQYLLGKRF